MYGVLMAVWHECDSRPLNGKGLNLNEQQHFADFKS